MGIRNWGKFYRWTWKWCWRNKSQLQRITYYNVGIYLLYQNWRRFLGWWSWCWLLKGHVCYNTELISMWGGFSYIFAMCLLCGPAFEELVSMCSIRQLTIVYSLWYILYIACTLCCTKMCLDLLLSWHTLIYNWR